MNATAARMLRLERARRNLQVRPVLDLVEPPLFDLAVLDVKDANPVVDVRRLAVAAHAAVALVPFVHDNRAGRPLLNEVGKTGRRAVAGAPLQALDDRIPAFLEIPRGI